MSPNLRRLWFELNKERSLPRRRKVVRQGRSSRAGIAMLMVVSIIAIMTVMVTEIVHASSVRIQLAANQRDEAKAEALAQGGIQFYRLLLIASKQLEGNPLIEAASQMIPGGLNADQLWQVIPTISSNMLRILLVVEGDEDAARRIQNRGGLTDKQMAESREKSAQTTLKKAFLDFDGDFTASVKDEDSKIFIGNLRGNNLVELQQSPHGILLGGLFGGDNNYEWLRENDIEAWELIGNLADWTDIDDNRVYLGGRESLLYEDLPDPYLPKNAPFDTVAEIRLVAGWERETVWERFGQHLTIYGGRRINVNTANQRVIEALLNAYVNPPPNQDTTKLVIDMIQAYRSTPIALGGGFFRQPNDFVGVVRNYIIGDLDEQGLTRAISTKSSVFRVKSKGEVGKATTEIEAVLDFSRNPSGKVLYWRVD